MVALLFFVVACATVVTNRAPFEIENSSWDAKEVRVYCQGALAKTVHGLSVARHDMSARIPAWCWDVRVVVRYVGGMSWASARMPFPADSRLRVRIGIKPELNSAWVEAIR